MSEHEYLQLSARALLVFVLFGLLGWWLAYLGAVGVVRGLYWILGF